MARHPNRAFPNAQTAMMFPSKQQSRNQRIEGEQEHGRITHPHYRIRRTWPALRAEERP
jgi:hypothetical protein